MIYTLIINSILLTVSVTLHYEALYQLAKRLPSVKIRPRFRVLIGVFAILLVHIIEIWLFALGYYLMISIEGLGTLSGNFNQSLLDCSYFSFTTYTTVGFGDIEPLGNIRFLTGLESLIGLVLITWSASFLFLEMQKYWPKR
ncbi:MAG: two pore domain potassium channel family protein [Gammaproteobacteria bacterium]|nr:MAG: two pore domain potassium channel family protein [Gammaproteobacteria bacterium]RKZ94070.1 MAG: two pore domain potassium channel family protein [Gammaproteobacteria bacterium]RKZ95137.1 MAG: two pore domain potassium channel family protein [Gammaproteobacteria bacterium]RLA02341.1 MAG: two pore domain potassium channel family protein [Gammaproteobacteria bacterium]